MNLPNFEFKIRKENDKYQIFDRIRQTFVALTPEEWVRQHFVHYLREHLGYPLASFALETRVAAAHTAQRTDTIIYGVGGKPWMVVEYKAAHLELTREMWQQICRYNLTYKAAHLVLTNGRQHMVCQINYHTGEYEFLGSVPSFADLRAYHQSNNNE